ncbi:MAG: penicillin-binding protein [Myxococcales bacterium]|nr:penicillin-binding protein [Myxococcales bacterium]
MKHANARRARGNWRTWARRLAITVLAAIGVGSFALAALLEHYEKGLPSTAELGNYQPEQVTRVLARDGTVLAELFVERRTVVRIEQIPDALRFAVLAAEDADFYRHRGLDYFGMLRALFVNLRHAEARQGGSTITQQVVKNVLLSSERTFERKARELLLARRIEQQLDKDQILELYLNHIYFGHGRYGVEEASRYFFGKGVASLSLAEAALLAGVPKGPKYYSPRTNVERATGRRDAILEQVALKGFMDRAACESAKAEPIRLAPAAVGLAGLAPEVVDEVERMLERLVGPAAQKGGFTVTTTVDPELQAAARAAVRHNLDRFGERHRAVAPIKKQRGGAPPFAGTPSAKSHGVYRGVFEGASDVNGTLSVQVGTVLGKVRLADQLRYNPARLKPSAFAEEGSVVRVSAVHERGVDESGVPHEYRLELGPQSALVAIDVANGEILALIGSYEGVQGGLDRATSAHRQPGSTFKPFVFGYGVASRKLTAATIIPLAEPLATKRPPDAEQKPPLLVRDALARSVNEAANFALAEVGADNVIAWARTVGLESAMKPTASLALGAYEVTPRELAEAYATFASGGMRRAPVLVTRIVGPGGEDVPLPAPPAQHRAIGEAEAFLLTSLLTSVIEKGTGRSARSLGFAVAGKTGTSNDARDAWFAGYSAHVACVVWTGFDDGAPLGANEQGAVTALPAWIDFMRAAHRRRPARGFVRPKGIVEIAIDPMTGLLAREAQEDARPELFLSGTEPREVAPAPDASAEALPEGAPEALPEGAPEALPEGASEALPDGASEALPDGAPEALPDGAPEAPGETDAPAPGPSEPTPNADPT